MSNANTAPSIKEHWSQQQNPHDGIYTTLRGLQSAIEQRDTKWKRYIELFTNQPAPGWNPGQVPGETEWRNFRRKEKKLKVNPIASVVQTLAARIGGQKIKTRRMTSTSSGDIHSLRKQARLMDKAVQGEWFAGKVYRKVLDVFHDSALLGMGAMKITTDQGRLCFERVFPGELVVDEAAFLTSEPRTLYQIKYVPVEVLAQRYPKNRKLIESGVGNWVISRDATRGFHLQTNLVEVVEAWQLPSGRVWDDEKKAWVPSKDGRWAMAIEGGTMDSSKWMYDSFPFAFLPWAYIPLGFWRQGVPEREEPIQQECNKLHGRIQDAMHMHSNTVTTYESGSINEEHLTNITGVKIPFKKGTRPPEVKMPNSVSSEVFNWEEVLYGRVFEEEGVSMLSAASKKPAGVEAAVAFRELASQETGRHFLLSVALEDFYTDLDTWTTRRCKELAEQPHGHVSRHLKKVGFEEIEWGKLELDEHAYEVQTYPASFLPQTPAGRAQTLQEMLQAGFLDRQQAIMLWSSPDLEQYTSLEVAGQQVVEMQIELMLDGKEEGAQPEPWMDLQLGLAMVTKALLRGYQQGVPKDKLALLLLWVERAQNILFPPQPDVKEGPMPPSGPEGAGGGPGGMPAPIPEPQSPELEMSTPEEQL